MLNPASVAQSAAIDDYRWLVGSRAALLLDKLAASGASLTSQVDELRRQHSAGRTHLLVEQATLRTRARAKFSAADRMFFTARGLEQATDEVVADHKARRVTACQQVFDLCSGVGGDLMALARVCDATAFDRDPVMAMLAEANLRTIAQPNCDAVVNALDVERVNVAECDAWHIDPDRRPRGRRTTRVELHEPGIETIEALLARNGNAALKLAPVATLPERWTAEAELEWISRDRECRQLVAWFGTLATEVGRRRATVLRGAATRTVVGTPDEEPPDVKSIDRYLFEPDAAVLAAGLGAALAREYGLAAIAPRSVYLTGPQSILDPALACFEVLDVMPFRLKPLAAYLRARNVGTLEIKKRGVEHDPEKLRKQLKLAGDEQATLIVSRIDKREIAIVARRVREG